MKAFVNLHDGSNVTEISPILTCIHTLNESFLWDEDWSKYGKGLSLKQLRSDVHVSKEDGFCFAVSLRDGSCLYTSDYITNHLGYPKDMLNGQCIMNFLFHKDHITFANHLTQGLNACFIQEQRDDSHLVLNTFFCRLRMYHSLKFGYSVSDRKTQYKPFKIILHINELIVDDVCVERPSGTLCVKASATHVSPAYSTPGEIPAMTSFSTRHTASCHFSHVDASAIPYLGYLPQDMIGYSVFDFYHIDDMLQLKDIYELVVKEHGSSFRSKPYRFKVQNGCYILLETEWSCFINPWSHKLEFVVGQHRVLKGPLDIDIFSPCQIVESTLSHEITKEGQNIQKEIKALLSQTCFIISEFDATIFKLLSLNCSEWTSQSIQIFEAKKAKRFCNKRKRDLAAFVCNYIGESLKENKTKCNGEKQVEAMDDRSNSDPDSVVMGDISPYREINYSSVSSETPPTVQQLRCQENIERFFASLPNTYSNGLQEYDKNDNLSSDDHSQASSSSGSGNGSGKTSASECQEPSLQSMSPETNENNNQKYGSSSSKCDTSSFTAGDSGYGKSLGTNVLYSGSMPYFPPAPNAQPQWLFGPAVPPMSTPKPVAKPESSTGSFQFPSCSNDSATNCLRTAFPKFSVNENLNLQSSGLTTALTTTNTVAAQSEMDFEKEKCCANTRSHKIELTTEIAYRYQMNVPSMADVLKKDRDFLNSLKQPELVNRQLQLLQGEREAEIKSKLKVEENEFCMTEEIMLGLATEDDVNEELEYREECLLQLISEDSL